MRNLLTSGLLVAALVVAGCKSNQSPGNMLGASDPAGFASSGTLTATPPSPPSPPSPPPTPTPGVYGTVSNLNLAAGTFTLTIPNDSSRSVTTDTSTVVLYEGSKTPVGTSALADGETVTVAGLVSGLPQQARFRAQLIIINRSAVNQTVIGGTSAQ